MSNFRVSCYKLFMCLFFFLAIFYSCTDDDLFYDAIGSNIQEPVTVPRPFVPTIPDSIPTGETDSTTVETDTTIVDTVETLIAKAEATPIGGIVSLEVAFTASSSMVAKGPITYKWNFKDGTMASMADPVHMFKKEGIYDVELTATNAEGLTSTDTVTITVNPKPNEAPMAVLGSDRTFGEAPLEVKFTGSSSTDDKAVTSYLWDFGDNNTSSAPNPNHTYDTPGEYNARLTVSDSEGLSGTDTVTITVTEEEPVGGTGGGNIPCSTGGGKAGDTGHKVWCWNDIAITENSNWDSNTFSNGELRTSSHCNTGMVTRSGNRLNFKVNPTAPAPQSWCDGKSDYNYRSEIRTSPSDVDHPVGTEEWFGWNYKFGNDYKVDNNEWIFWQVHDNSDLVSNPLVSLWLMRQNQNGQTNQRGEMAIVNTAKDQDNPMYTPIGIVPKAGDSFDIVVHVIWGTESNGLFEVWINQVQVYSERIRTVPAEWPYGGYAKWGIYKWRWRKTENVQTSQALGINELNTSMGPLRMITRRPGDPGYGQNSYSLVAPD